jgi:hypothetical protein
MLAVRASISVPLSDPRPRIRGNYGRYASTKRPRAQNENHARSYGPWHARGEYS